MSTPPLDPEALLAHDPAIRAIARSLLLDDDRAADVVQQTFAAAVARAAAPIPPLRAWLAAVARNLALEVRRRDARRLRREQRAARPERLPSALEVREREETRAAVVEAVLALEEPFRSALLLRFFEDLPPRAIARELGVPVETVRSRIRRGLERVRARLDGRYGDRSAWSSVLLPLATMSTSSKAALAAAAALLLAASLWGIVSLAGSAPAGDPRGAGAAAASATVERAVPAASVATVHESDAARAEGAAVPASAADPAPTDARGSLVVRCVFAEDDAPAPGIHVRVLELATADPILHARTGTTDAAGSLRLLGLAPGPVRIEIDRGVSVLGALRAGEDVETRVAIGRGLVVEGRVVDGRGAGVAEADVWLSRDEGNPYEGAVVATTEADGRFRLRGVKRGQFLSARKPPASPATRRRLDGAEGTTVRLELRLGGEGGAVSGRVTGPDGAPVARARVALDSGDSTEETLPGGEVGYGPVPTVVETDAEGRFTTAGLPRGTAGVYVRASGLAPLATSVVIDPSIPATLDLRLDRGARVAGTVRDAELRPLAGASVSAYATRDRFPVAWFHTFARTGADGAFRFESLPPGSVDLRAGAGGLDDAERTVELVAGTELLWEPVLRRGGEIHGVVLDERGAPCAGWLVAGESISAGHSATTGASGRFALRGCAAEPHEVRVHPPGAAFAVETVLGVRPGEGELVLRVAASSARAGSIAGRVVDEAGAAVANAELWLRRDPDERPRGSNIAEWLPPRSAAGGAFHLGDLPPGAYRLDVRAGDAGTRRLDGLQVAPGAGLDLGDVALDPPARLSVVLRTDDGAAPEEWTRVEVVEPSGEVVERLTVRGGALPESVPLPPGRYLLRTNSPGATAGETRVDLRARETTRIEIPARRGSLLELRVPAGEEVARVRILVRDAEGRSLLDRDAYRDRDEGGFALGLWLPAGRFSVEAAAEGGLRGTAAIESTGSGDPRRVEIALAH